MAPSSPSNAGNAVDIVGLLPVSEGGTTTPNLSTRAQITNIGAGAFNNPTATITGDLLGFSTANPLFSTYSNFLGKVDVNVSASTTTGITEPIGAGFFSGSSAIGAGTAYGVGNSTLIANGSLVDPSDPTQPGNYFAKAIALGSSIASTDYGVDSAGNADPDNASAAAVLDLASVGSNSRIVIGGTGVGNTSGIAGSLNFNASTTGTASATGIEVGKVTLPGNGPVNNNAVVPGTPGTTNYATAVDPLDGTGVNSILNLQARGYNNQTQFFQQPISPFFAQFSGLVPGPNADQPLNPQPQDLTGRAAGEERLLQIPSGTVNASATVTGNNSASNGVGDTNAFTGAFATGLQLANKVYIDGNGNYLGGSGVETTTSSTASTKGSSSAITNVLANGIGTSAIRDQFNSTIPNGPLAPRELYLAGNGVVSGVSETASTTSANSGQGDVVAFTGGLTGSGGNTFAQDFNPGNALSVGLFNVEIDARGNNAVSGFATSDYTTSATSTVEGDAKAAAKAITAGILGNDISTGSLTPNNIDLRGSQGTVSGIAEAMNTVNSVATTGNASSFATTQALGITNELITISGSGSIGGTGISITNSSASA